MRSAATPPTSERRKMGTVVSTGTCFNNYEKCLKENATDEEIRFSEDCHWMGPDYFILAGTLFFGFFVPAATLISLGMALKDDLTEDEE